MGVGGRGSSLEVTEGESHFSTDSAMMQEDRNIHPGLLCPEINVQNEHLKRPRVPVTHCNIAAMLFLIINHDGIPNCRAEIQTFSHMRRLVSLSQAANLLERRLKHFNRERKWGKHAIMEGNGFSFSLRIGKLIINTKLL